VHGACIHCAQVGLLPNNEKQIVSDSDIEMLPLSRKIGRRATILIAGVCFLVGISLCAAAMRMGMLIIGRIMIGLGVGFGNQVRNSGREGSLSTAPEGLCKV